jgi:hypothetical protein
MGSHIGDGSHRSISGCPLLEEEFETVAEPARGKLHFAGNHCRRSLIRINRRRCQGLGKATPLTQVNARFRHNTY